MSRKSEKIGRDGDTVETWTNLKGEGEPLELSSDFNLYAQLLGELSGAQVGFEGSNVAVPQDTDWSVLPEGAMGHTIKLIATIPRWIRPVVEGGDEHTDVSVLVALRKV